VANTGVAAKELQAEARIPLYSNDAGHFLQLDQPEKVADLVLGSSAQPARATGTGGYQ
jgi:pimeloyl-ACP methyl ester carboxylesterase